MPSPGDREPLRVAAAEGLPGDGRGLGLESRRAEAVAGFHEHVIEIDLEQTGHAPSGG